MASFRFRLLTGTAAILSFAGCAQTALADTRLGWYVAVDAGHGPISTQSLTVSDITLTSTSGTATAPLTEGEYKLSPDYGARGFARVGYRLTPHLRGEVELGRRPGRLINGLGGEDSLNLGTFGKTSLMANLIYDINPKAGLHPFVGVGAGMVQLSTDYGETVSTTSHTLSYSLKSDKLVPAAQLLAGASWDVTRSLQFDMTYRYLRTGSASYDISISDVHDSETDSYTAKGEGSVEDHSLTVGLRWMFGARTSSPNAPAVSNSASAERVRGAPASQVVPEARSVPPVASSPAPLPPPDGTIEPGMAVASTSPMGAPGQQGERQISAPVPEPRRYTAFFPLGGAELSPAAHEVVGTAAQYVQTLPASNVKVDGYADTTGSSAYNLLLSRKRAQAVADELIAQGVAASDVHVAWHGENHLAVQTGDNVALARNRRVTIDVAAGAH